MFRRIIGVAASAALLNVVACSGDNSCEPVQISAESSSSVAESSSSAKHATYQMSSSVRTTESSSSKNAPVTVSSSSAEVLSSSSEQIVSSSSARDEICRNAKSSYDLYNGPAIEWQVNTGADNGSETSGYWFGFSLADAAEKSSVIFPRPASPYETGYEAYECCEGVCGAFDFVNDGSLGVGFIVAGASTLAGDELALGDISNWGGLCVTYASETDLNVALSNEQGAESYLAPQINMVSELPKAVLTKSVPLKTLCLKWDDFTSAAGSADPTQVASVLFYADGTAGSRSRFKISGLGKYTESQNFCEQSDDPFIAKTEGYKATLCSFNF